MTDPTPSLWAELREWQRLLLIIALSPVLILFYIVLLLMIGAYRLVRGC